jgi:hypothetical protein
VPTASAIYEVNPERSGLKPYRNPRRICHIILISVVDNLISDKGYPDGRNIQTGLADRILETESDSRYTKYNESAHVGRLTNPVSQTSFETCLFEHLLDASFEKGRNILNM